MRNSENRQAVKRMDDMITEFLNNSFYGNEEVKSLRSELEGKLYNGTVTSYKAAMNLLKIYFKKIDWIDINSYLCTILKGQVK